MAELTTLGAVVPAVDSWQLTELGGQMARLPVVPRVAKLLLVACGQGLGGDALIVSALVSIAGSVFFRAGSLEEVQAADQKKIQERFAFFRCYVILCTCYPAPGIHINFWSWIRICDLNADPDPGVIPVKKEKSKKNYLHIIYNIFNFLFFNTK